MKKGGIKRIRGKDNEEREEKRKKADRRLKKVKEEVDEHK